MVCSYYSDKSVSLKFKVQYEYVDHEDIYAISTLDAISSK
jgi:hypothetical protein